MSSLKSSAWIRSADNLGEPVPQADRGAERRGIEPALAIGGMEPEQAQNAQVVFLDPPFRLADEAHAPLREVGEAADLVDDAARPFRIERVHGEVAAQGVVRETAAEGDDGPPAVRGDVLAQRRDLDGGSGDQERHRAVLHARGDRADARLPRALHHRLGKGGGGEIDVARR